MIILTDINLNPQPFNHELSRLTTRPDRPHLPDINFLKYLKSHNCLVSLEKKMKSNPFKKAHQKTKKLASLAAIFCAKLVTNLAFDLVTRASP